MQPNKQGALTKRKVTMETTALTKAILPVGLAFGLFASQQNFILTAPDNTNAGQGMFETDTNGTIRATTILHGKEFAGTGRMADAPRQNRTQRSDRAFMEWLNKAHAKHGFALLTAKDGATLACEFNIKDTSSDQSAGHCLSSVDHLDFTVRPAGRQP
jgi:hypothetical protein